MLFFFFFFSSRRRHTRCSRDWSSDVCSSDLSQASRSSPPRDQVVILPRVFLSTHMRAVTDLSYSSFEFTCTEIPPQDIQCRSRTMRMGGREEALPWGRPELWCWHW